MAYPSTKLIYEILEEVAKVTKKKDKVEILKQNESWALKDVLRAALDDVVVFTLPPGPPPYTASQEGSIPSNLLKQNKKFTYIVKGGKGDQMPSFKREKMFIEMLESIHPKDAEVLIKMKDKKSLGKGITKALVNEAFPGLIVR